MSHIPSSAMPHAGGNQTSQNKQEASSDTGPTAAKPRGRASKIADKARDNPKTAVAAGVAVAGALAAAAAIPIVRARKKAAGKSETGSSSKGSSSKSGSSKSSSSKSSSSKSSSGSSSSGRSGSNKNS